MQRTASLQRKHPDLLPDDIVRIAAQAFGHTVADMKGPRRLQRLTGARQATCYLLRRFTLMSYAEIGRLMGGRDHSTVMTACAKTANGRVAISPTMVDTAIRRIQEFERVSELMRRES